jgi:hypothetical protein
VSELPRALDPAASEPTLQVTISAHSSWRRLVRLACVAAATVASVVPFVLVLDLFFHILGAPPKS